MAQFRKEFEDQQVTIIDEMSMLGSDRVYDVCRRLQEIHVSQDLFGGKGTEFVGDVMQLPPVKAKPVFSKPKWMKEQQSHSLPSNELICKRD